MMKSVWAGQVDRLLCYPCNACTWKCSREKWKEIGSIILEIGVEEMGVCLWDSNY